MNSNKNCQYKCVREQKESVVLAQKSMGMIWFHSKARIVVGKEVIQSNEGNLLLFKKSGLNIVIEPVEEVSFELLLIGEDFIDNHIVSQMTDCPIFYDFLRLEAKKTEYLFFDTTKEEDIVPYIDILFQEAKVVHRLDEKMVKCALVLFLTNLHHTHHQTLIISESTMMQDYEIGRYLKYMSEHFADVTLSQMAEHFNFHPAYFSGLFKELSGYTFTQKLLMIKLEQAKRLLVTTNLTVNHITELIGFKEKSYFYRSFKKQFNETPISYRKRHQKLP